jgi:hypothetical protein
MLKKFTKKDKRTKLEREIDDVVDYMKLLSPETKEYTVVAENLERLHKAKAILDERKRKVSPDAIVGGVVSLVGIGMIIWHEKADVITTKALGFVTKGKV